MAKVYVCDIPVYRCAQGFHDNAVKKGFERLLTSIPGCTPLAIRKNPDLIIHLENEHWKRNKSPWRFNQVVGWIRVWAERAWVCGELWWADAKQLKSNTRIRFVAPKPGEVLFSVEVEPRDKSSKVFQAILAEIERLACEHPLKNRHVELAGFRNIGAFVNWRELLNQC